MNDGRSEWQGIGQASGKRDDRLVRVLRPVMLVGLAWLILGMAVMPAGVSYNPGKAYQYVLVLTLCLPALALIVARPRRSLALLRQPLVPWAVVLLAWGCVSLAWTNAVRPADEAARDVSILLFLVAWWWTLSGNERLISRLLVICGMAMAPVAVAAFIHYEMNPPLDGRMAGFGVMANANLAAGGMGAALIWLWPWQLRTRAMRIARWVAVAVLALFVLLTLTRSAWVALFVALAAMVVCRGGGRTRLYLGLLLLLGGLLALLGLPVLLERGWSLRPQIFAGALKLFLERPLLGHGQGAVFEIPVGAEVLTHAHNMFSQLAVELGLPGLLLWSGIWLALGWRAWRHRHEVMGQIVVGLWMFAMVMVQFDLPHLLDSPRPGWLITWLPLALSLSFRPADAAADA